MARRRKSRRTPGEGSVFTRNDTGKIQASLPIGWTPKGNVRRISKSFDTRAEALAWLAEQQAALGRGAKLGDNATLQEVYDGWHAAGETLHGWAPNTAKSYRYILQKHVLSKLGRVRTRDIGPADIRSLLKGLADDGYSLTLIRRVRAYTYTLLEDARRMNVIQVNPAADIKLPTAPEPEVERWSEDEIAAVVRECLARDSQAANYVLVALGTGLRTEEMLGLTWADVDLEEQVLMVRRVAPPGKKELREGGKTDNAVRPVTFDDLTASAFRRQHEYVARQKVLRGEINARREKVGKAPLPWTDWDLVFVTSLGTILDRKTLRRDFDEIQTAAGVTRIRLYATRHTSGSALADAGVNLHALAERYGHSDRSYLAKKYLRGSTSAHRAIAEKMGSILEAGTRCSSVAEDPTKPATTAPMTASTAAGEAAVASPGTTKRPN